MKTEKMYITQPCFEQILKGPISEPCETGGGLFGYRFENGDWIVTDYVHDSEGHVSSSVFMLRADFMNSHIQKYEQENKEYLGQIHSHSRKTLHAHLFQCERK